MIKCPSCGFSNDDNCTFCAICGSSVTQDDFYVNNTTNTSVSVEELTKKLISKDQEENARTKSFKKLDKATILKEAAKIDTKTETVKEYKGSSSSKADKNTDKDDDIKIKTKATQNKNDKPANKPVENMTDSVKKSSDKITEGQKPEKVTTASSQTEKHKGSNANVKTENVAVKPAKAENKANTKPTENTNVNTENKAVKPAKVENKANTKTESISTKSNKEKIEKSKVNTDKNESKTSEDNQTAQSNSLYELLSKFFFGTKNDTMLFKEDDIDENCNMAIISYIPFLFFVPMIIKPCSGYLRYHGIQGLTMFLSFIVLEFFDIMLSAICNSIFSDMVGIVLTVIITVIINIAVLLLISIGIANAVKGEARELPIIGKYKLLKQYIY